jgi:hypothetical protein
MLFQSYARGEKRGKVQQGIMHVYFGNLPCRLFDVAQMTDKEESSKYFSVLVPTLFAVCISASPPSRPLSFIRRPPLPRFDPACQSKNGEVPQDV